MFHEKKCYFLLPNIQLVLEYSLICPLSQTFCFYLLCKLAKRNVDEVRTGKKLVRNLLPLINDKMLNILLDHGPTGRRVRAYRSQMVL